MVFLVAVVVKVDNKAVVVMVVKKEVAMEVKKDADLKEEMVDDSAVMVGKVSLQ